MNRVLIANRGEIAVRVIRAAHELGWETVAVHPADDAAGLHVRRADRAVELPGAGPAAYLDPAAIVEAARRSGANTVHPGYGFLSENTALARACEATGLVLVGPGERILAQFGDKARARAFAEANGVPVTPGTARPTTLAEAEAFLAEHGPTMVKALAGGGGRGMAAVAEKPDLAPAFERCASEARAAFGSDDLYVEKLVSPARHIEVQVLGDGAGTVIHLWERDCSIQRRHQKLIEVAPAPALAPALRARILDAATTLAAAARYCGVGTFEFLITGNDFFFMEANPRLQVEHTITEEITGVDLVRAQLLIAHGATLTELGLTAPPPIRGVAIQARINAETLDARGAPRPSSGTITDFTPPSGPGVRVDTCGYSGYPLSPRYDSLLAKVIAHGPDLATTARRGAAALADFGIAGVGTNRALLRAILSDADFIGGAWDTDYLPEHLAALLAEVDAEVDAEAARTAAPQPARATSPATSCGAPPPPAPTVPAGSAAVIAPMGGVVVEVAIAAGATVPAGTALVVLEAMKMEHVVRADRPVRVTAVLAAPGELIDSGAILVATEPVGEDAEFDLAAAQTLAPEGDWSAEVDEIERRRAFAEQLGGPDKIARQHDTGRLTVRERITALADTATFAEIGVLTGFATRDQAGAATTVTPANFLAGTALLDGRKAVIGADDFTVRGGSGDAAIHAKQIWLEQYANQMRLPMVRLLDGQSGGGSVKMAFDAGYTYVPINPGWDAVVDNLSVVPVAAAALGPTVGLGAARLVMSHLAVLVEEVGSLFTAGPPLVRSGTGEDLSKEELGGADVHRRNGSVERIVETEARAFEVIRDFLAYLPRSVYELPPVLTPADGTDRPAESLLAVIPRDPRHPYDIYPILDTVFDAGSVFTYAEYGGGTVTALARLDGHPVGVIAADPFRGATMSTEGALALTRLVDLCETFHLPIVSLTDQAGMSIGSAAEQRATIRHGARAISAVYQARIPQAEVILRRVYGVGGAGIVNRHRAVRSWAWPSGDWGSLPVQGGVEAAFKSRIAAAEDPLAETEFLRAQVQSLGSPFRTAEHFGVQDVIDPRTTRALLCDWVTDAYRLLPEYLGRPSFGTRP